MSGAILRIWYQLGILAAATWPEIDFLLSCIYNVFAFTLQYIYIYNAFEGNPILEVVDRS